MNIYNKDILSNLSNDNITIIIHGCNCFHTMNGGIAKYLKNKFPIIYEKDKETKYGDKSKLGTILPVKIRDNLYVINCYTQYGYGKNRRYLNYEALYRCFCRLKIFLDKLNKNDKIDLRSPMIGCGLAGGDWEIVSCMLEKTLPYINVYYL